MLCGLPPAGEIKKRHGSTGLELLWSTWAKCCNGWLRHLTLTLWQTSCEHKVKTFVKDQVVQKHYQVSEPPKHTCKEILLYVAKFNSIKQIWQEKNKQKSKQLKERNSNIILQILHLTVCLWTEKVLLRTALKKKQMHSHICLCDPEESFQDIHGYMECVWVLMM